MPRNRMPPDWEGFDRSIVAQAVQDAPPEVQAYGQLKAEQRESLQQHEAYARMLMQKQQAVSTRAVDLEIADRMMKLLDPNIGSSVKQFLARELARRVGIDPKTDEAKEAFKLVIGLDPNTAVNFRNMIAANIPKAEPGLIQSMTRGILTGEVSVNHLINAIATEGRKAQSVEPVQGGQPDLGGTLSGPPPEAGAEASSGDEEMEKLGRGVGDPAPSASRSRTPGNRPKAEDEGDQPSLREQYKEDWKQDAPPEDWRGAMGSGEFRYTPGNEKTLRGPKGELLPGTSPYFYDPWYPYHLPDQQSQHPQEASAGGGQRPPPLPERNPRREQEELPEDVEADVDVTPNASDPDAQRVLEFLNKEKLPATDENIMGAVARLYGVKLSKAEFLSTVFSNRSLGDVIRENREGYIPPYPPYERGYGPSQAPYGKLPPEDLSRAGRGRKETSSRRGTREASLETSRIGRGVGDPQEIEPEEPEEVEPEVQRRRPSGRKGRMTREGKARREASQGKSAGSRIGAALRKAGRAISRGAGEISGRLPHIPQVDEEALGRQGKWPRLQPMERMEEGGELGKVQRTFPLRTPNVVQPTGGSGPSPDTVMTGIRTRLRHNMALTPREREIYNDELAMDWRRVMGMFEMPAQRRPV